MISRLMTITLGALSILAGALSTQAIPSIEAGARVRLSGPALGRKPLVGVVQRSRRDSLVLLTDGAAALRGLPWGAVTRLEVARGQKRRTVEGAWLGTSVGAVAGLLIGMQAVRTPDPRCSGPVVWAACVPHKNATVLGHVAIGGLIGAGLGAALGSLVKRERWETVARDRPPAVAIGGRPLRAVGTVRFTVR